MGDVTSVDRYLARIPEEQVLADVQRADYIVMAWPRTKVKEEAGGMDERDPQDEDAGQT